MKYEKIRESIVRYTKKKGFDKEKIVKACQVAEKYHQDQKRKSGEPYVIHPLTVAMYLTDYNADEESIIAAILHDTVEDTEYTMEDVRKDFGEEISQLIDGLTKFSKNRFREAESMDRKIESMRKWFSVMQDDIRVAVIKLVDRVHNMETLEGHSDVKKQKKIAKETLDVFVKIANKLGIGKLQEILENLCLKHLEPQTYKDLVKIQQSEKKVCKNALISVREALASGDINGSIIDVRCSYPSLFKMHEQEIQFKAEIKGVLPLIFVVHAKSELDCYQALYIIHNLWKNERTGLEDYINNPKQNGYKGLHTTVIFDEGRSAVFKIRTADMERYNKYGVTENCFSGAKNGQKLLGWLKHLPFVVKDSKKHSQVFWQQLQHDILEESILVHTEKDDCVILPSNSTVMDAAFHSYGRKAFYLQEAFLNGNKIELDTHVNSNDTIHFKFDNTSRVQYDWLSQCDTSLAKMCIRQGLKDDGHDDKVKMGKNILNRTLMQDGKGFIDEIDRKIIQRVCNEYKLENVNYMYQYIAEGELTTKEIISQIFSTKTEEKPNFFKLVKVKAKIGFINDLINKIPKSVQNTISYTMKGKGDSGEFLLKIKSNKNDEWQFLDRFIKRNDYITHYEVKDLNKQKYAWGLFILLAFLWGTDPIIAAFLLKNTAFTPIALTVTRFWSIVILLGALLGIERLFFKKIEKEPLAYFNIDLTIISISIFFVAFLGYSSLLNTLPSDYMLSLGCVIGFFTINNILNSNKLRLNMLFSALLLGAGIIVLYTQPSWPLQYKLWMIGVVLFFGIYSQFSENYQKKKMIFSRYSSFLFKISLYAAVVSTFLIPITIWPQLTISDYLIGFIFANVFITTPYYVFFHLIRKFQDIGFITYQLLVALFIPFIVEIIFYKVIPSPLKTFAFIAIISSLFFLGQVYKASLKKN